MIRKYFKLLLPQLFFNVYNRLPLFNFKRFWNKSKSNKYLDKKLIYITDLFVRSKSYKLMSNYWEYTNIKHFKSIIDEGDIQNYALLIARNYNIHLFTEEKRINKTIERVEKESINYKVQLFKLHKNLTAYESFYYNVLLILLFENLKKITSFELLKKLNDDGYLMFDDPYLEIDNIKITHDKINSLFDYDSIKNIPDFKSFNKVLEFGAGSGRTSEIILTFNKNIKYVICDIPPAIYISCQRLKVAFPEKQINLLLEIDKKEELERSINKNDISFIFPHQIELISKKFFNLTLGINCFHEMDKKTLKYYFKNIENISEYFFFTVWKMALVPYSYTLFRKFGNSLIVDNNDYPIGKDWKIISKIPNVFPCNMIKLLYKLNS